MNTKTKEILKNLILAFLLILIIVIISNIISRFGENLYRYLNKEIKLFLSDSLTAQTLAEYRDTAIGWIDNIKRILND